MGAGFYWFWWCLSLWFCGFGLMWVLADLGLNLWFGFAVFWLAVTGVLWLNWFLLSSEFCDWCGEVLGF